MGCDIHLIFQLKESGYWKEFKLPFTKFGNRNYEFFAAIAGVRGTKLIDDEDLPMGWPDDLGEYENIPNFEDMHHKFWLDIDRLSEICKLYRPINNKLMKFEKLPKKKEKKDTSWFGILCGLLQFLISLKENIHCQDIRVLIYFDS